MYSLAFSTAFSRLSPFARFAAIALERVHPVPCVFGLFILRPLNHFATISPFSFLPYKKSLASFTLWPPFTRTEQPKASWILRAASSISNSVVILRARASFSVGIFAFSRRTSASGILGVITVASGRSSFLSVSIASSLINFDPLVATITGSTTRFLSE